LIDAVKKIIGDNEISKVVVASRGGKSAVKLAESLGKGVQVISISEFTYNDDTKKRMKKLKMIPVENADLVIQDNREITSKLLEYGPDVKAAFEVALIAKQKGLVKRDYVSISGKKTTLVVNPDSIESELQSSENVKKYVKSVLVS
jgi:hypothetical protein